MKFQILSFLFTLMASTTIYASTMTVVHSKIKYAFPDNPKAVVFNADASLIITYKKPLNNGYISISDESSFDTGSCSNLEFFDSVVKDLGETPCGYKATNSFKFVFMNNALVDTWKHKANYYLFFKKDKSHIFKVTESSIVLFSSSFLKKDDWHKMLIPAETQ